MFTLTDVLIDALWILGLAGVFATFSYMDYYRHLRHWRWREVWQRPLMLTPLSVSLTVFSLGLALSGATAYQPDPWWQTLIWATMTLLFGWQSVLYSRIGIKQGWSNPIEDSAATPEGSTQTDIKEEVGAEHRG